MAGHSTVAYTTTNTFTAAVASATNATESAVQAPIAMPCTAGNLYVALSATPGTGHTIVVTLRVNAADTTLACTVAATGTTCTNLGTTVPLTAGELIDFRIASTGTGNTTSVALGTGFTCQP
jgi:hypothetical protein